MLSGAGESCLARGRDLKGRRVERGPGAPPGTNRFGPRSQTWRARATPLWRWALRAGRGRFRVWEGAILGPQTRNPAERKRELKRECGSDVKAPAPESEAGRGEGEAGAKVDAGEPAGRGRGVRVGGEGRRGAACGEGARPRVSGVTLRT